MQIQENTVTIDGTEYVVPKPVAEMIVAILSDRSYLMDLLHGREEESLH